MKKDEREYAPGDTVRHKNGWTGRVVEVITKTKLVRVPGRILVRHPGYNATAPYSVDEFEDAGEDG